ncbi:MAG: aminotransferase class III-fold pyridoxal phosphate-dependent enzyme [Deltaproteobacteria bacterium]|nr:aminotransferase class III-fold pyridoxal phosphate-dependent enzyme [Deltaproteobacteria bacterium]
MSTKELRERRSRALAPAYELFYDDPVHLVRGEGVWLFDNDGRRYLDCYNNVPSVGHCHPRVVEAIVAQARLLNTHTRYLHENVVKLGERLGTKFAGKLGACWFVCTGTEANDLATQIARTVTGRQGMLVGEGCYHGNSDLVLKLSTSSYPAKDRPDWLAAATAPDTYRGPYRAGSEPGGEEVLAERYADSVADCVAELAERGHQPAAMLVDSSWDDNGLFVPPRGYLARAASIVREAGGLFIADEVQAGYCRLGDTWWGHERYDVVPDLVVLGKPMGGGHPVAAVVSTPEIAAAFGERVDYFNTFGGNPVSAAAALAVLDVIDEEGLLKNAHDVGQHLGRGLAQLAKEHSIIGDVRGAGLFWGIDLVSDRESRQPVQRAETKRVVSAICREGVLTGIMGTHGNVIKIRPPLPFSRENADHALEVIDGCLRALSH